MRIDGTNLSFLTNMLQKAAQKQSVLPDAVKTGVAEKTSEKKNEDRLELKIRINALTDEQKLELTKKAEFSALSLAWSRHKAAYECAVQTRDDFVAAKESKTEALAALEENPSNAAAAGRWGAAQKTLDTLVRSQNEKTTNETARAVFALIHRGDMLGAMEYASEGFISQYSHLLFADANDAAAYFTTTEDTFLEQMESSISAFKGRVDAVEQAFVEVGKKYGLNGNELRETIENYKKASQNRASMIQALERDAQGRSKSVYLDEGQREELKMRLAQSGMSEQKIAAILRGERALDIYV